MSGQNDQKTPRSVKEDVVLAKPGIRAECWKKLRDQTQTFL
jgi:hypothetical protein